MFRMLKRLSLSKKKEDNYEESSNDEVEESRQELERMKASEGVENPVENIPSDGEESQESNNAKSRTRRPSKEDEHPDTIQIVQDGESNDDLNDDEKEEKRRRHYKRTLASEELKTKEAHRKENMKLILEQIALGEESARLRRKEKREKKRMELSKYLGIDAWKCDQKFLLNYGPMPEDIQERVMIIRKRNVKKERQRRIDEFVVRAEINRAARKHKRKS